MTNMKFHLAINLERMDGSTDMIAVRDHTLCMVQMADAAGFEIAWAAEHHALEMTIAPNPFQILTWWAEHTRNIRLGVGVANTAYWHPIGLAGEAGMLDLISGGRLELGIGSGAYQREFDRMHPGLQREDGHKYMQEALPLIRALWQGDVAHDGPCWQFPTATACPKPLQDNVPMWVAARSPTSFDFAVEQDANLMCWPLTLPMSEAVAYRDRLSDAKARCGRPWTGRFAMMRHTCLYENARDRQAAMDSLRGVLAMFGNLMTQTGAVVNGFPEKVPLDSLDGNVRVDPAMLESNLMFGSPDQVVEKLHAYKELGVDSFIYYASMGLDLEQQKRSLQMFIDRVMPEFT